MEQKMKVGVAGASGRMGGMVIAALAEAGDMVLSAVIDRPNDPGQVAGQPAADGAPAVTVATDPAALFADADGVIDFSVADAAPVHAGIAAATGKPLVIGTTGLTPSQHRALADHARRCPLLVAPNMSPGVTLLLALTRRVAAALGPDYDIEVLEMHHRHKTDAPSGTALGLGQAAAAGRQVALADKAVMARQGQTGPRPGGSIGFAALRGGDVIGDHSVIFAGAGERLELTHRANDRRIYAHGALAALRWLAGRPAGLYSMADVWDA